MNSDHDEATAERQRHGYYTVSEAAKFLALRHVKLPDEVVDRPFDHLRTDESLAMALGFQDCAQVKRAVRFHEERGAPLAANATALFWDRAMSDPVVERWLRHYENEIFSHIRAGRLRAIDRWLWKANTAYQGDPATAAAYDGLFVLATEINALEAAQGSTLPPLSNGLDASTETPAARRARLLAWRCEEVAESGEHGALERVTAREKLTRPTADRSNIGKAIKRAIEEQADARRAGALLGPLGK